MSTPVLYATVGQISKRLGVEIHKVQYMIKSRGVEPAAKAGNAHIYTEDQVTHLAELLGVRQDSPVAKIGA